MIGPDENPLQSSEALLGTRTPDPFLTMQVPESGPVTSGHTERPERSRSAPDGAAEEDSEDPLGQAERPQNAPTGEEERFLDWLSGFIDGEGCFVVARNSAGCYGTRFRLCLRDDDVAILQEVVRRTGLGAVYRVGASGTSKPQAAWAVESKRDCLGLVRILDAHPLRARKARDYGIWRIAVFEWHRTTHPGWRDWSRMAALKEQLASGREYDALPVEVEPPLDVQLLLDSDEEPA